MEEASSLPGRAGQQPLPPFFFYKWTWGTEGKGFNTLDIQISLKISEEKKKEGEKQGRGASTKLS